YFSCSSLLWFFDVYDESVNHTSFHSFPTRRSSDLLFRRLPQAQPERDVVADAQMRVERVVLEHHRDIALFRRQVVDDALADRDRDRKSTRLNSSHDQSSYAVFCLKKKKVRYVPYC